MLSPLLYSLLLLATPLLASPLTLRQTTRQYIIYNKCPTAVNLYIGGVLDSSIPQGGNVTKFLGLNAGFFYTDANGGDGPTAVGTTRAGFYEEYYYIVEDPSWLNVGLSITTQSQPQKEGFCGITECDDLECTEAYTFPPLRFPTPTNIAPTPPLYECPFSNVTYDITFCPIGKFPNQGTEIHPNYNTQKCMDVRGANFANGTPVQIYDCNGTPAQSWTLYRGSTKVQVTGTNFCLDAGSSPANGVGLKIWQCYDNLPAQQWYYTTDNRIALEGQGFCTDLTNGVLTNSNQLQTWQCTDNNLNQVWML
ncbi:G-X-X-X-Q-X-W domain-containing protein [Flammula alnicola]|nr:G-X-X-X-Q-X-W domain-containing protein [Flammula alnicola]